MLQEVGGSFYEVSDLKAPIKANYELKSVLKKIGDKDNLEWFSLADSNDLSKKESIFLEFDNPRKASGLVIDKRESLMTTFLFYHTLSLFGRTNAYYFTKMENGNKWLQKRIIKTYDILGGIEVSMLDQNQRWIPLKTIREAGPIVSDTHFVALPEINSQSIILRLRMTQGLWRINRANLAVIHKKVKPLRISPVKVTNGTKNNQENLEKLNHRNEFLVTYPGDVYQLNYPLSYRPDFEYFIESQGYYIEWIREEWLKDENLKAVKKMLLNPSGFLKKMAPLYKVREVEMEKVFWTSKYTQLEN
ncbi:hypothetical protein QWY93_12610 [Echinicola jeungdonensis]|uniref:Uncharacterized protein n=1 Tax=Echinicola jeungdonensis TaxID=709343 RepID=A0ABV5JAN5_9BACT|nr:hypothetical protein [Echinicola jeungdonensis]MDN3670167.1 hypothetical protein [Echinicola jeungdonensis]